MSMYRRNPARSLALVAVVLSVIPLLSHGAENKRATSKADAWIGREASELLLQLRVDGGRVRIREIEATGETAYTWSTWNPGRNEIVITGSDITPGPVLTKNIYTKEIYHPPTHRCEVTYYADLEGIVRRWEYTGKACGWDIDKPKNRTER
jgi:hypothetical protein